MNSELLAKLIADFKQSGFGSEMKAARFLLEEGWEVTVSPMFTDLDTRLDREFDVLAELQLTAPGRQIEDPLAVLVGLCCEVKKSATPWVVLRKPSSDYACSYPDLARFLFSSENGPTTEDETFRALNAHTPRGLSNWIGYGIHDAFKKPNADSQSYKALTTAVKCARDYFLRTVRESTPIFFDREKRRDADISAMVRSLSNEAASTIGGAPTMVYVIPAVVLDGELYSVEALPSDEPDFQKISYASLEFRFGTEGYKSKTYTIDIVTLSYFPEYIRTLKKGLADGAEQLSNRLLGRPV